MRIFFYYFRACVENQTTGATISSVSNMLQVQKKKKEFIFLVEMDFVKPFSIFKVLDKNSQNAVNNAAKELRRNYSKKVFSRKWKYFSKSENGNSLCVGRG